ncbi:MAG: YihY/virulence factor BrkB family protein, partial [Cytophagaceae bacterium]
IFVVAVNDYLRTLLEDVTVYIVTMINIVISLGVNMSVFALIYKVLPDARIKWKDVFVGAFITTLLFLLGQFLIGIYLSEQDLDTTYGAAGALVLLLLWVYFASVALLLGAQFTYTYAKDFGGGIEPTERAMEIEIRQVEKKQGKKKN